jgi:hypothetical protein
MLLLRPAPQKLPPLTDLRNPDSMIRKNNR